MEKLSTDDKALSAMLWLLDVLLVRRRTQGHSATSMCLLRYACNRMGRGLSLRLAYSYFSPVVRNIA